MHVLVAGGTGMLGAPVVRALVDDGHRVRVLTRRPDIARATLPVAAEVVSGDLTRAETLPQAVAGCQAIHVSVRGADDWKDYDAVERRGLEALLGTARDCGVRHVTYLSGAGQWQGNEALAPIAIKLQAEKAIRESGVDFTIFRATHFMESLDLFVTGRRATVIGRQPHRYRYLAAQDFACLVVRALATSSSRGKTLYAFGPDAYTMSEALTVYLRTLRPEVRLSHLPAGAARTIAFLTGNRRLRFAASLFEGFTAIGEAGDPAECNALLGPCSTTLAQWLETRACRAAVA